MLDAEIKELKPQPAATIRVKITMDQIAATLGEIYGEVGAALQRKGVTPAGMPFAWYHSFGEGVIDLEAGFPVAAPIGGEGRVTSSELPGGQVAVAWHIGPYDTCEQTYNALLAWIGAQGCKAADDMWEVYWTDPTKVPDPSQWRTEVVWPLS